MVLNNVPLGYISSKDEQFQNCFVTKGEHNMNKEYPIKENERHLLLFFTCPKCGTETRTFVRSHSCCEVCEYPILKVQWEKKKENI